MKDIGMNIVTSRRKIHYSVVAILALVAVVVGLVLMFLSAGSVGPSILGGLAIVGGFISLAQIRADPGLRGAGASLGGILGGAILLALVFVPGVLVLAQKLLTRIF